MRNTNKKGFTIVELVIVVAVIAILAAVLIPTFSGIITKANLSADQQAVRQMNTALAIYAAENGAPEDVIEAKKALDEQLVNVEGGLTPVTQGYAYYWDSAKNEVVLVATGDEVKSGWYILTANAYGEQISASSSDELLAAFAKASEGPVSITLTSDVTLANAEGIASGIGTHNAVELIAASDVVNIDLNGKTLTLDGGSNTFGVVVAKGGTLTIENGTLEATSTVTKQAIRNQGGTVTLTNVVIEDSSVESTVMANGISDTAIVDCTINTTAWYAVSSNTSEISSDGARVSIIDTDITAGNVPVMLPIISDVTIDGCNFTGVQSALVLRGLNAIVKNSTFTYDPANAKTEYVDYKGAGAKLPAAAIILHAGGDYGGSSAYTFEFENVTADTVNAGTTEDGKMVISGLTTTVNEMEAVEGSITVK